MGNSVQLLPGDTQLEMGGPCLLSDPPSNKRVLAPTCTDNFQILPFSFQGRIWHSVEQCYQAQKFAEGSDSRAKVENCVPFPSENGSMYGNGDWREGDHRESQYMAVVKVEWSDSDENPRAPARRGLSGRCREDEQEEFGEMRR